MRFFLDFAFGSSLDDIFIRLLSLTSYLSRQVIHFIEDLVFRDIDRFSQDSEVPFSGRYYRSYESSPKDFSPSSLSSDPSSSHLVLSRRTTCHKREFALTSNSDIVDRKHCFWNAHSIFHGLTFPVHGFRLAWKLVQACLRCTFIHLRSTQITLRSFISRVHKTLHGSSEDIGWLQRTPGLQPVEDGTTRFKELLCHIRNGDHTLPNTFVYLLIPGLFSNYSPLYFVSTKRFFSKMGLACHIAKIHSEASVEQNAWELKQYIEELYWGSGKRVLLLGHSKGGVDAAAALSLYWTKLKDKVGGLALVQSPYGGTPVASDILRDGQIADKEARWIMEFLVCKVIKGDMRALEDLTYDKRKEFLMKNKLPDQVPLVSFHTEASISPFVLATLSHIAHAELPWLPIPYFGPQEQESSLGCRKIPVVIPVAAAMAVCALHLKLRYGEQSDGLVTRRDAEVPGSVVVRLDRKLDHAWMVYSSWKQDPIEPDASQMCEALFTILVEIGKKKQRQQEQVGVDSSSS